MVTNDNACDKRGYTPHYGAMETAGISEITDGPSSIIHNKLMVIDDEADWMGVTTSRTAAPKNKNGKAGHKCCLRRLN